MLKVYIAGWLVVIAAYDLGQLRIPNWLLGVGAVAALIAQAAGLQEPFQPGPWAMAGGALAATVVLLPAYVLKVMGAADVKLGIALALWFTLPALCFVWIVGSLLCALHAVALLIARAVRDRGMQLEIADIFRVPSRAAGRKREIPYGAYLAIGALVYMAAP